MLASHQWLRELSGLDLTAQQMADAFTSGGLEVEGLHEKGTHLDHVVVAEVRAQKPHPARENLKIVSVFDGTAVQEIVCGASNVPEAGGKVLLAQLGAKLPNGIEIAERKLGGVSSCGMLCGETELDLGSDDSGLLILEPGLNLVPGQLAVDTLRLRDTVLEISVAPNRPDCLGHIGLARELCAVTGASFPGVPSVSEPKAVAVQAWAHAESTFDLFEASPGTATGFAQSQVRVDVKDPERCPRYGAALVEGVTVARSPFHVRYRLHVLGLRAISNVVDATNLILHGFGHPIHAFDFDRLAESRLVVRRAVNGEKLRTLDGEDRVLTDDDLLICDGSNPVALAGVMGGADSEIHSGTTRVLIECAVFEPRGVRRTSRRLGMHTDSSHRFERGVDRDAIPSVLRHAASTIASVSGGRCGATALDLNAAWEPTPPIRLRSDRMTALLGTNVPLDLASSILGRLGCSVAPVDGGLSVKAPAARPDLTREVDLIEEVARIVGYDSIPTRVPHVASSVEGTPGLIRFVRKLRECAAAAGFNEAVNYAFVAPHNLESAQVSVDALRLANPMSEERSVLRTSLLPGLLADLQRAQRHQVDYFAQFEVARVFTPTAPGELPRERIALGLMMAGAQPRWVGDVREVDVYDLKGALESIVGAACTTAVETRPDSALATTAPYLHPRRSAFVLVDSAVVGHMGELHPDVVSRHEITGRPVYAAIDVHLLWDLAERVGLPQATPLPRFPASVRDLAVVVPEAQSAGDVALALRAVGGSLVEALTLFDIYRGEPVEPGFKSLAFRVVYRDSEATLTDKVVEKAHARIVQAAGERFGAKLRQ